MPLPEITHLQFQILGILMAEECPGSAIRASLQKQGIKKSGPAFYQLMSRLEGAGLISGWYRQKPVDGQMVKERWYKLLAPGSRAWRQTHNFYLTQAKLVRQGGLAYG
jgi:DNA-binding PadR family transcriptional regulator